VSFGRPRLVAVEVSSSAGAAVGGCFGAYGGAIIGDDGRPGIGGRYSNGTAP